MRIYNKEKTKILDNYNLNLGYLKEDIITINEPEIQGLEEQGHYETIREYKNGGKDVEWIVDVAGVEYRPARTYDEEILVYVEYTKEELEEIELNKLRQQREIECFSVINQNYIIDCQSKTWFDTLTEEQKQDANIWVQQWRDVTETKVVPTKPSWIK